MNITLKTDPTILVTIKLDRSLWVRFRKIAERERITPADAARNLIIAYIEETEKRLTDELTTGIKND